MVPPGGLQLNKKLFETFSVPLSKKEFPAGNSLFQTPWGRPIKTLVVVVVIVIIVPLPLWATKGSSPSYETRPTLGH